jgi:hypothetical protein
LVLCSPGNHRLRTGGRGKTVKDQHDAQIAAYVLYNLSDCRFT